MLTLLLCECIWPLAYAKRETTAMGKIWGGGLADLSIYLSIHFLALFLPSLSYLSICLFAYLSVSFSRLLSLSLICLYLSVCPLSYPLSPLSHISLSVCLPFCLSLSVFSLSYRYSICLSFSLSITCSWVKIDWHRAPFNVPSEEHGTRKCSTN